MFYSSLHLIAFLFPTFFLSSLCAAVETSGIDKNVSVISTSIRISGASSIYFHGVMATHLYVNGERKAFTRHNQPYRKVDLNLQVGDVIGIHAYNSLGPNYVGVAASIVSGSSMVPTGSGQWLATQAFEYLNDKKIWSKPEYNACSWDDWGTPVVVSNTYTNSWKSTSFPYSSTGNPQYVFVNGMSGWQHMYLRYRVGGETCVAANKPKWATIYFRATSFYGGRSRLYINGARKRTVRSWFLRTMTFKVALVDGDVVAIKMAGGTFVNDLTSGILVSVVMEDGTIYSTGSGAWKSVSSEFYTGGKREWTKRSYNACAWESPQLTAYVSSLLLSDDDFPFSETQAKYVVPKNINPNRSAFYRLKIGGDNC